MPTYNIAGITQDLKFTPETLSGIFLGTITKWNDPRLAKDNPGVKFPNADIQVVHRSDGSGTTFVWTDYLSKVSPEWKSKVGANTSVNWPVGLGGKGNEGVAGTVKQTPNSIGYVELIYAVQNKMAYGSVKNASGNFRQSRLQHLLPKRPRRRPRTCRTIFASRSPTPRERTRTPSPLSPGC